MIDGEGVAAVATRRTHKRDAGLLKRHDISFDGAAADVEFSGKLGRGARIWCRSSKSIDEAVEPIGAMHGASIPKDAVFPKDAGAPNDAGCSSATSRQIYCSLI